MSARHNQHYRQHYRPAPSVRLPAWVLRLWSWM